MNTVGKSTGPSGPSAQPPASGAETTATVKQGESSVSDVAKRVGVSQQSLKEANPQIKDPNKLTPGQELKLPEKKEPQKQAVNSGPHPKTSEKDSRARMAERSMEGVFMEANLRSKTDTPPPDADTLIKKHTGRLGNLDEDELGKELAGLATKDFAKSKKTVDGVMDNLGYGDRDDVALAFTTNLSGDQLKKLASSTDGQSTLHRMEKELLDGNAGGDERREANRIHDALKGAKLDPGMQSDVLIDRYTRDLRGLDHVGLGKELASMAKNDPAAACETIDKTLDKLGYGNRDDVSVAMSKNMSDEDMKKMAATKEGAETLSRMEKEILDLVSSSDRSEANRIHTALGSAKLDPKDRAGTLIERHTYGPDLKEDALGKELAEMAKKDPAEGAKQAEAVLDNLSSGNRDEVAYEMTKNMTLQDLTKLGGAPGGRDLLERMNREMTSLSWGFNRDKEHGDQVARLNTAKTAVDLERHGSFKGLSEATRKDVLSAMERTQTNASVSKNIATLSIIPGFEKLPEATRKEMIDAMEKKGADPKVSDSLRSLAANADFRMLYVTQGFDVSAQANVVKDLTKFTETESYKKMSETDKAKSLNIISELSLHSAEFPKIATARNTLNHLVNGTVKMELYEEKDTDVAGKASGGTMKFNTAHPDFTHRHGLVETAAHEVNHVLNGETQHGTPERFLSEYSGFYVSRTALGINPPDADYMKMVLRNIATNAPGGGGYDPLREMYQSDPEFKKVVDRMAADLNQTPPRTTSPEDLRLRLKALPGGDKSDYLDKTGNLDNH